MLFLQNSEAKNKRGAIPIPPATKMTSRVDFLGKEKAFPKGPKTSSSCPGLFWERSLVPGPTTLKSISKVPFSLTRLWMLKALLKRGKLFSFILIWMNLPGSESLAILGEKNLNLKKSGLNFSQEIIGIFCCKIIFSQSRVYLTWDPLLPEV